MVQEKILQRKKIALLDFQDVINSHFKWDTISHLGAFGTSVLVNIDTIWKKHNTFYLFAEHEEPNRIQNSDQRIPDNCNYLNTKNIVLKRL